MSLPPILSHKLNQFKSNYPSATGKIVENMDASTKQEFSLDDRFLVCTNIIHLNKQHIDIINGGGAVLGGKCVHLKTNRISIGGTAEDPIQIVALGSLEISAKHTAMRNVNLYTEGESRLRFCLDLLTPD